MNYNTRLYSIWKNMKKRCYYPKHNSYKYYGGKGIKVCDEWLDDYKAFKSWALSSGYNELLSIDRIDINDDYRPENCRWSTPKQQSYNRSTHHIITFNGESHALTEWADMLGINFRTLSRRLTILGWPVEKALFTPVDMRYSHAPIRRRS
jgi:hypothetical protein